MVKRKQLAPIYAVEVEDVAHNSNVNPVTQRAIEEGAEFITLTIVGFLTCRDRFKVVLSQSGDLYDDEPRYRDHYVIPAKNVRRMRKLR